MITKPFFYSVCRLNLLAAIVFGYCVVCSCVALAEPVISWETDFDQATSRAKMTNRLLFIHFYGENCPLCKLMETSVFTNPSIIAQMNRDFVPLKVNIEDQPLLAKRFAIKVIPTDIVLQSDGQQIHRRQGGIHTEKFGEYLVYLLNSVQKEAARQIQNPAHALNQPLPNQLPSPTVTATAPQALLPIQPPQATEDKVVPLRDPFTRQPVIPSPVAPAVIPAASTVIPAASAVIPAAPTVIPADPTAQQSPQTQTPSPFHEPLNTVNNPFPNNPNTLVHPETRQVSTHPIAPPSISYLTIKESTVLPSPPLEASGSSDKTSTTTMVEVPLVLEGYCPVILSTEERWIPGNPAYYTMYRGHVFRFSSEEAMTDFLQEPAKYSPVAMGEDIVQMVERNKKVYGNRKFGAWFQGRVYLFCSQESLDIFAARPEYYSEIALKYETAFKGILGRF
jgi:YHS domain-containing protein/thioredoxin-related protein